jgi:hypothetical protein
MCNLTLTFKRSQQQCCNKQQLPLVPHVHYQHQIGSMCPYVMGGTPVTRTHTHTHTHTQAKVKVVVVAAAAEKECEPVGMPQEGALGNSFLKCFHQMCLPTAVQKL